MKSARTALSSVILGGLFVAVPVVSVSAAPHAVAPSIESVPMPAPVLAAPSAPRAAASCSGTATSPAPAALPETVLTRATRGDLMVSRLATIRTAATTAYRGVTNALAVATPVVETYTRPSGTSITLDGRGFGHGRGMSQYGAYGAALQGLTDSQITAFYYPGTTRSTTAGNPSLRVRLTDVGTGGTQVAYLAGLTAGDGTRTVSLNKQTAAGAQVTRWRVVPSGSGLSLQWYESGWQTLSGWSALGVAVTLANTTTGTVRVVLVGGALRDYRGTVRTHRVGIAANSINDVSLQSYLQGVVPSEMPASWPAEALQAQAVAARTYALRLKSAAAAGAISDICDSTACQVYRGAAEWTSGGSAVPREYASSTAAVAATSGIALTYGGGWVLAEFTSSNGGQTVASSLPYQVSKADPYDAVAPGSTSAWTRTISLSAIQNAYPSVGTFEGLRVDSRDGIALWGGRTKSVTVLGSAGSTQVTGGSFQATMGLRSPWWTVATAPATSRATFPKDPSSDSLGDLLAVDPGGDLRVLRGNGAGAFSPVSAGTGWGGFDLITSAGAWTSDNRHDVLARRGDVLYVYAGVSGGTLLARAAVSTGWSTRDLLLGVGDLDGDKHPDLVSRTTDGRLWLHHGNGAGGVVSTTELGTGWQYMRTIVAPGDLTGDGIPDLLGLRASDDALLLYPGTTGGTLSARVAVTGTWSAYSDVMGSGDLTGDGRSDVVLRRSSDGALVVFAGDGLGGLTQHHDVTGTATWASWTRWAP